ncbi:MAG: DnaD domain-containing protein [Bacillota bacterium]|nr:DnaD domain protein [Clostridia bacterium]
MTNNKWEKRFFFSAGGEGIFVPNLLLKNFRQLGLTEGELVFILQLLMINKNGCRSVPEIAELLNTEETQVKQNIASLMEKGFLVMENRPEWGKNFSHYFFDGLYDKLIDLWACELAGKTEMAAGKEKDDFHKKFGEIFSTIEKEFGRPLTNIENEKIIEWLDPLGYHPDLILEALKRAVLRGVYNLNYIDRILLDWHKANIRTLHEAINYEKLKMSKNRSKSKKITFSKTREKDLNDLYEL